MEQAMRYFLWIFFFSTALLRADTNTFSSSRVNSFYDTFVCEEKDDAASVNLTGPCTITSSTSGGPFTPPPPLAGHLPIFIVNRSGYNDSIVYFIIYGYPVNSSGAINGYQSYVDVVNHTLVPSAGVNNPASTLYSYQLSSITKTNGHYVIYIPYLRSGNMLFGIKNGANPAPYSQMSTVNGVGTPTISLPIPTSNADANYYSVFGASEITFLPVQNQLTYDYTCVNFYSFSYTLNYYQNGLNIPTTGSPYSRATNMTALTNAFNAVPTAAGRTIWNDLVSADSYNGYPIRVLAPNNGFSATTNYYSNTSLTTGGRSWAMDAWTGSLGLGPYYAASNGHYVSLNISFVDTDGSTKIETYIGNVPDYTASQSPFVFTYTKGQTTTSFKIPFDDSGALNPSTSACILTAPTTFTGMTYSQNGGAYQSISGAPSGITNRAIEITKEFAASISTGLLPLPSYKTTEAGPVISYVNNYYTNSTYLSSSSQNGGPWYTLNGKALIANTSTPNNKFYTFTYDDYLYNNDTRFVVAPSIATVDSSGYLVITLYP